KAEAMIQPVVDLLDGKRSHACGGELDRERDAIEAMTDGSDRRGVLVSDPKVRMDLEAAIDEQLQRLERSDRRWRRHRLGIGQRQGRHAIGLLAGADEA